MNKLSVKLFWIVLLGIVCFGTANMYAGTAYTNGRAFLKQGSPTGGGKVYVASNATEPTSGQYKAVTSSTSPAFNVQVAGDATFNYWAVANPGYIFTGWYTAEGALQSSGAAHISKKVTAGQAGGSDTHAYADFYASFIKQIQLSFVMPTNGSFTITHCGSEVTPAYSSFTTEGKVVLTALPADGYKLRGWYTTTNGGVTKNYFAFGNSCEPNFTSNVTIGAEFVPDDGKATFWIKGTNQIYDNLTSANTAAASSSSKLIVVVSDGVVGAGTYTISSGVTLLIPYEETYNLMTTPNIKHIPSPNAASKVTSIFRKLTLASGATINVSGNICIGGSIASCNGGSPSSFPTGSVGMLDLSRGGTINLASGSNLYAWGYVKGQDMDQGNNTEESSVGEINAASGATVWEDYQVGEWRGGTASSTIYSNKGSWKFFPFQSYSIQNIEAPVNYAYGSNCKCYWTIFGNGSVYDVKFPLIASSGSLFKLASGGTVRKWYDPTTDHVCFELGGAAALDALTLSVMGETVSSSDYYLPIPANLKIILKSGNSLTVSKPMTMHAGSVVEVKSGATLTVNNRVHLFDADDWDTYCMYAYYYRTYYSPSLHFNRGEGTAKTTLEDATVIVDGTVDVKGAYLYSSAHGSNICGNGGGTFKYAALPSNTTMTQCKVLKDNVSVNIRSANLHNDNDTYTKGIASTTFKNVNGRWFTNAASTIKANKTYDFTYISSGDVYGTGGTNKTVAACWSKDKTGLELQDKWANIKTQGCTDWWEGIDDGHLYNWSRNSAWHQYIKAGSTTTGSGEDAVTTDTYAGSDGKMLYKTDCEFVDAGTIDGNCLYPSNKALVNGSLIAVTANTSPDHGYHATADASAYYLCFEGCVWHPATRNAENLYTVDGTKYIWYGDKWMAVEYDSGVSLHYSLSATNVKIYYEYVGSAWVLATPVAEVVTSAGTEQVFSLANAITKAKAGGTNVTIRLLKDISGTISYDGTNNCGLDLNGFTLSSSTSGMITVNSATTTFIIKDQSAAGTGKVQLSYSANTRRYAISVTKGHLVVNSGTISATNTMAYNSSSAKTVDVGAITVANGHKVTVNGGTIEAISDHNPYGIYLAGATAMATINGGTIEAKTTERSSSVDSPYGIIGAGSIYVNGGTVKATCYRSSSSRGISSSGTFMMTGGSVIATASSTCYGVYAASGSNTTISGGTVTSTTTGATSRALYTVATATLNGGTLTATAGSSDAKGIYVANGTTTVNAGTVVNATATTKAYGIYYADNTPTVTVNGGAFTVSTTSTTEAYGVYAAKGTGTINDGTFTVTAKTTGAEGMHVETANTPKLTLNGGKFMVKNSNGSADGTINNTGATLANFSMAAGYFNVAPNGTTNIASGKVVKDVDNVKEKAIYDAGYRKKIAGTEHTVTWKNYKGAVLATTMVEDGKLPVWSGANPTYTAGDDNYVFQGWAYSAQQRAGVALTAVTADVDIYAAYINMQAELIANGTTTQYEWAHSALIAARAYKQATVRLLAHCGNNIRVHDYVPTVANAITTLDLNGHTWECLTVQNDEDYFLNVNKSDAKLIITDNSGTGAGKLSYRRDRAGHIYGFRVQSGELVLQGGTLECIHTGASNYQAIGVSIGGTSAKLTMTGGTIEVAKTASSTGGSTSGIYAYGPVDITGGRIYVHNEKNAANGIYTFNGANGTVNVGGDVTVDVVAKNNAYGTYGYGTINVDGGTFNVSTTNGSNAVGFFPCKGSGGNGSVTVDGNPTVNVSTTSGTYAYGVKLINVTQWVSSSDTNHPYDADGVTATINSGTFTITSASSSASAIFNHKGGEVTVNGGTFNVKTSGGTCSAVEADYGSTTTINDGTFTVGTTTNAETSYWNVQALHVYQHDNPTVNINGGHFAVTNSSATTSAYFIRAFGGYINMKGDDINVSAYSLIYNHNAYYDNDTCFISIDGGEYTTTTLGIEARRFVNAEDATKATDMEVTIWDGKFKSINSEVFTTNTTNMPVKNLKLRGGYFSKKSMSKATFDNYVVSPSTSEELTSGPEFNAGYKYHVTTKYNVTWSVGGVNTVQEYNRNEIPSYGSTPVYPGTTDTYEFTGWDQEIVPVTGDITYTAQFQKWEAEVYEGENPTPMRFAYFTDAFREAQELPVARIKVLSNVYYSTSLTLNPTETAGSKPLTIDLNNHVVNYTPKTATYALTINKAGCKLIIDDSSVAKGGQFGHRQAANNGALINAIYLQNGELELAGGTIIAQNNNTDASTDNSKGTRAVVGSTGTVFTMTGGKLYANSRFDARAFNSDGNCTFNATGGTIEATTEYATSTWGNNAYGVVLWNYGTFNMSGTATMNVTAASGALGVYPYGAGGTGYPEVNISGGSINCLTKTGGSSRCVQTYGARATTNISGGDITANGPAGQYNIEDVTCQSGATVNITGGNFHSTTGANCVGVRVFEGTATIGGTAFFDSRHGVVVGDWATSPTSTATAYVNGGTFDCPEYVLFAKETTNEYDSKNHYTGTVTGTMYVNGGYFKTASGNYICGSSSGVGRLILHGGYYNETSGTTQKSNITTYKSATTEVSTLSPAITVEGRTYHYQLLTDFDITWLGGDSYSKVTTLKSGTMPTNTDLDGKCFLRNDSAFYFTGWNPTPVGVTGDATYNAEGVYHEASVKVGSAAPIIYDDFDEAWAYAMEQSSATITLLTNLTRTSSIVYNPAPANARHTFDLNNFTIKENTNDRLLVVNKSDAKLTITDNSSAKGGCLYKKMNSSANMYTTIIYHGEMILAGGKIYVENTKDDKAWHPALAVHTSVSTDGIFTMTGGTVESQAKYLAYPIYNYATTNISGGTVIANATSGGAALGLYALAGTATISGGTFNVTASTNATGAIVTGWINNDGSITENGVLNITGGTFNVSPTTNNARAIQATGTGKNIGGTIYTAHGIANISGGTFNVACPPVAAATQIFGAVVDGWRLFDGALPHTMIGESRGEMNISGGTFTIDARDNGTWVANSGNVDLLRSWGTLNVSGGNFTLHQYSTPSAISVFRGKTTVSGNPVFNVYSHTGNAYAVCAGYWTSQNYCDKDAANNLAEAEINGGTFKIITEGQNTNVIYSLGQISAESRDGETITAHAGYAMNAKVTVNGGEFLGICPNASGKYPIMLNSRVDQVGTYGTAKSEIYVNGGKFKSRKGTEADNTTSGAVNCHNNVGTLLLTGGYYETNGQLAAQKADTCVITNITSADIDPEYNNGYRYRIDVDYQVKVTHGAIERKFINLNKAFEYAKTVANPTITLLKNATFAGPYTLNPTVANWRGTLNLNNFTITSTTTTDRFFTPAKSDAKLTITDNSGAKGGVWNFVKEYNGALIGIVVDQGELILAGGKLYTENTMSAKSATGVNIWGTSAKFTETGGTLQVKTTSATAEGIRMRGIGEISGGSVIVTSDGSYARAFVPASDAGNSKYGSITVSGTPTITVSGAGEVSGVYANVAGTTATISGGTWNISSTTSTAYGVRLSNANTATISGGTFNVTATTTSAYGVYVSNGGSGTVSGGTFTSRNGAGQNECFGAFATGTGTTLDITGGTFDVNSADNAGGNINVVRVQPSATVTISGGTFRSGANSGYGLVAFGGVTTVSGTALFEAYTGAYAGSWYQGDGTNDVLATVNLNGGTFNVAGIAIDAMWNTKYENKVYLDSPFSNSIINVNGGRYKTTSSTIVRKKANGADGGTATLNIAGGYFNEKSGDTFKNQIATYVADTCEINTLDPLYEGTYKYEVAPHYVASVTDGVVVTNYTTFKAAFDYAKTRNNSVVTLLDDCDFETNEEYGYNLCPSGKTMTLDLNNHTVNGTSTSYDRVFGLSGQLTITDNSGSKEGKLSLTKDYSSTFIGIVLNDGAKLILEEGTIYVENERASQGAEAINIWGTTGIFTQTGGLVHVKASGTAKAFQHRGTINIEGGEVRVVSTAGIAIGDSPAAEDPSTDKIGRSNISGTAHFNITGQNDAYGVYNEYASNVSITGGRFDVTANTNNAYGIRAFTNAATITVNGPVTINTTSTTAMAYSIHAGVGTVTLDGAIVCTTTGETRARSIQAAGTATITINNGTYKSVVTGSEQDSYVIIPEGTSAMTVNGGKFHSNKNNIAWANTGAGATLTINGGYFNESSGSYHKNQIATYKGDGKVIMNLDTDEPEYAAGYRYVVTADPVAKVKAGSEVTYYTSVADAITAANNKTNPTVTMLKDATTTQQTITAAMTLDLNGKTITSTQASSKKGVFSISASGQTVTITDSGTGGKIDHTASYAGYVYGVALAAGTLNVTGGTIYAKNTHTKDTTTYRAYGIYSAASTTLTISDGTIEAECPNNSYALGISATGNLTMTGGTVRASATTVAYGVYANNTSTELSNVTITTHAGGATSDAIYIRSGHLTVHSGTYTATGASGTYAIYAYKVATTIVEVEGGKFSGTTQELYKGANSTVSVSGGYYVHNTGIEANCTSNHHVLPASLTEGGITYNYKVAEAYTLTWTTDGDALTGDYTSGMTEVGATITAPNTPTKSGYTFAAWTPAVAATMPAANTTYTATWTRDTYTISYDLAGGSVASPNPTSYTVESGAITLNNPTKANYVFAGWTGTGLAEPTMTVTIPAGSTGNRSYTATWTAAVASVTINSGTPSYHTTLADAFNTAKSAASNATTEITVLKDILDITSQITYAPTNVCTTTLNLNGHLVQGAVTGDNQQLIRFSPPSGKRSAILEITDSSTGGKLHNEASYNGKLYCIYVNYGHLKISGGTVSVKNTSTGSSRYSYAIDTRSSANASAVRFTMTNGTVKAEGSYRVYAVVPRCTANISGGKIEAVASTSSAYAILAYSPTGSSTTISGTVDMSAEAPTVAQAIYVCGDTEVQGGTFSATATSGNEAYGIRAPRGTTEVTGNPEFTVTAKQYAYGVFAGAAPSTDAVLNNGTAIIRGGTFTVSTTTPATSSYTYAYGVYANAGGVNGKAGYEGVYASAGTIDVYGGIFDVTAYSRVYGIGSKGTVTQSQDGYESESATPKINIYGGKFKVTKGYTSSTTNWGAVCATSAAITNDDVVIEGGYFNTNANSYLDQYTAPTKSGNYYCLETTAADKASVGNDYNYKVAEAYTLTWNLDGGTVTTAGTGAAVDATGTPSIAWGVGDAITAPVVTKTGYTFASWSPAVEATMPAANTTYTAQWAVASVTTNDVTTLYTNMTDAWTAVTSATAASTLTMLQDVSISWQLQYTNTQNCTLDLNGHTITSTTAYQSPLHINSSGITFTITDGTVDKSGKLSITSTSSNTIYGAYAENGNLVLEAGTIEVISGTKTTCGVTALTTGTFTMNGGTIHVVATNGQIGRGLYFNGTMTVNSGTIHVEAAGNGYGIFRDNSGGTATVNGGKFNITSSSSSAYVTNQANNTYVKIYGGYYNINTQLGTCVSAPYHVFNLTSGVEYDEGYLYEVAEGYTLTWELDGGAIATPGTPAGFVKPGTALTAPTVTKTGYTFAAWNPAVAATMPAANTTYTAQWAVASVTTNDVTTLYTNMTEAWIAVNSATAASTLTMLQDVSISGPLQYTNTQNCTLDLNCHTITSTTNLKRPLHIFASCTFTITDGLAGKSGKLSMTTTYSSDIIFGACAEKGNLVLEAGTIEVISGSQKTCGVTVFSPNSFTMNGGTIHVVTSNSQEGRGLYFNGSVAINDGTIHVEAAGDGYAMKRDGGAITVNGGKFNINGATANINHTESVSGGVTIRGGWYNTNNRLNAFVTSPYYVLNLSSSDPLYAEGYRFVVDEVANTGFHADIVDVDNTNSKLILNVTGWASSGWPYTINGVAYDKNAREADRTLKVPYTGAPGDEFAMLIQKTSGEVISNRIYVIPMEVKTSTEATVDQNKNIFIKNGANVTVKGDIAVKNIYVAPGSKLTINSGKTLTADTIFLRTTAEGAAEMVKNGSIAGTTKLVYTRIIKDKDFHFFGLPLNCAISAVKLSDGVVPQYGSGWLLRSYDEARRSNMGADDNNWVSLAAGSTIAGGAGYELFSASNYYREFYFPVSLPTTNKVAVAYTSDGAAGEKQAGWNALVSPFTHTYTNDPAPEDLVVNWYMDGYGYYEQEIPSSIPPAKPFAFQTSEAGYLSFEGSAIAITKMPRRASEEEVQIQWIHLDITDADGIGDQTSVYSHPTRYEAAYQTGIDVAKQSLTAARAILYSSHAYGEMAFAGVADSLLEQGVALTVFSPKPQELTISLRNNRWLDRLAEVWLVDTETGAQIDLLDSDYTFEANEGTTRGRLFLMGRFKAPNIATDIDNTEATEGAGVKAQKLIIRDKMYIRINGQLYDATGKQVNVK